ncbi:MAG: 3-oxoacyl-ACP reductase FabG [Myxococcales bacterium]|nr:3-oxoacyl-ACP reductase FabG [Myxococcales bacterium]
MTLPNPRTALVTGGSRGIGAAVARTLARDGLDVVVTCVQGVAAAEAVAAEVRALGRRAQVLAFDVKDSAATGAAIRVLLESTPIDVVVNNAGIIADGLFPALSAQAWHDVLRTSLDGFYNVTQPLIMAMAKRRWGRVINMTSISGVHGNRGQVNYAAAKAGLIGATKSLALEFAKRGITVNAVAPGLIDTDMIAGAPVSELIAQIPMARLGQAQEVAEVVAFLASERASYVTGQVIAVAGGL